MQLTSGLEPFRWGIVGAGAIARQFVEDLRLVPGARVGGFHTRSGGISDEIRALAPEAPVSPSLDALLSDPSIDAIYIATPNGAHAEQALAAIAAGKPVLVEKPIATSSADAERIARAAAEAGVFAMEAMWTRFLPAVAAMRELVRTGAIGEVSAIRSELAYRRDEIQDGRFFDPALGGGASLDLGVYPLSLAIALMGAPTDIGGSWAAARTGVDRRADYRLGFGSVRADISCGFDRDGANSFVVEGTKGALVLHAPFLKAQRLSVWASWAKDLPLLGLPSGKTGLARRILARIPLPGRAVRSYAFPGNGLQFEIRAVAEAVRAARTASGVMPLADSVAVLRTIEAVLARPPSGG